MIQVITCTTNVGAMGDLGILAGPAGAVSWKRQAAQFITPAGPDDVKVVVESHLHAASCRTTRQIRGRPTHPRNLILLHYFRILSQRFFLSV